MGGLGGFGRSAHGGLGGFGRSVHRRGWVVLNGLCIGGVGWF